MTTRQLYYLVTISDSGSLSGAAQILGISQPALSKFLKDYEEFLGFPLFLRYRRQLTPTAVGRYVIEYAQKILDEQTRMLQTLQAATGSERTRIRLATAPNRGAIIYSRIYNRFAARYPDIALTLSEIYARDQPGAILHGQVDIAIGSGKTTDKTTDLPFAHEELLVSLPVSHPLAKAEKISLSDLRDTPFVLQGQRHSIRILAEELFKTAGFSPVVAFESNDVLLVDSMLHQAVGCGLVSQAHVFPCNELVYRSLDPPIYQTLHIRYPLGHTLTEPEQFLAALLIRERLSDPRYHAIPCPEAEELLRRLDSGKYESLKSLPESETHDPAPRSRFTAADINLNTQLLKYIIAILEEKSLTRAAERYYLTQPALSRHLRNLENMLCTSLFTRVHNRLQPTNAGKIFVNFARNILKMEEEMSERIRSYRIGHGDGISLQVDTVLAPIVRTKAAEKFFEMHPEVNLHILESDKTAAEEALFNASADFGLYFTQNGTHPILDTLVLAKSELVYCFASDRDDALSGDVLPEHFPVTGPVMLASPGSTLRAEQDRLFASLGDQQPDIVCEAQPDILNRLVGQGAADTILPLDVLSPEARRRSRPFQTPQPYYLVLVHHPAMPLPLPSGDLIRLLCAIFSPYFTGVQP